ncbi:Midasin [Bienertia sinuspersici]
MSANEDIGASTGTGSIEHLDPRRKYGLPDPSNKGGGQGIHDKKAEAKNVSQMMPSVDDADDYDDVEELDPESLNTKGNGSGSVQRKAPASSREVVLDDDEDDDEMEEHIGKDDDYLGEEDEYDIDDDDDDDDMDY